MALDGFMTIKGKKQGELHKDASKPDSIGQSARSDTKHHGKITIVGFNSAIVVPRDMSSGVATGTRNHQPVTFTKFFDRSSPLLWQALANNEMLDEVNAEFYRTNPKGTAEAELFFKIQWQEATLVEGKAYVPMTIDPNNKHMQNMEDWSFTYKKVKWEHVPGSTTGEDTW